MATINVKLFQIRRSYTAGYRPPTTGATALKAGESLRNYADGLEFHGVGDGTYTTQYLNANVVGDTLGRVPPSKATQSARNMAYNSDGLLGTSSLTFAGPAATLGTDTKGPNGFRRFAATATGPVVSGSFWVWDFFDQSTGSNLRHSVVAGQWYEFSVSFPTDTDSNYVAIAWFDAAGNDLGSAVSGGFVGASTAITGEVDLFNRSFIPGQAPPNAVTARLTAVGVNSTAFAAGKVFGVAAPMFSRCAPNQTEPSRYVEPKAALSNRVVCARNNAALAATSPLLSPVVRQGYAAPGDCPNVLYTYTASTITADGGSAVASLVGGTWIASIPEKAHVGIWGIVADSNGTTGNGTDNAPQFKKAVAWAQKTARTLFIPNTNPTVKVINSFAGLTFYRLGSAIDNFAGSLAIEGEGSETAVPILYIDHTGRGFDITTAMPDLASIRLEKFATYRNQPTPSATVGVAFTATANDWDIAKVGKGDMTINDVMMFNATNGLWVNYGRVKIDGLRGQFLKNGILVDNVYDTFSITNVRSWPYWMQNDNVFDYTLNNLKVLAFGRGDNPNVDRLFSIFAKNVFHFPNLGTAQVPSAPTSRLRASNIDIDAYGDQAILVETPFTTAQFSNITTFASQRAAALGNSALFMATAAKGCIFTFANLRSTNSNGPAINVQSNSAYVGISGFTVDGYAKANAASPVVVCSRGSQVDISNSLNPAVLNNSEIGTSTGTAALYFAGTAYTLAQADMLALPRGSGFLTLHDKATGSMAMFALGSGAITIFGNTSGSIFVSANGGTTAQIKAATASGKLSVGFASDTVAAAGDYPAMPGGGYRLYNNTGSTVTLNYQFRGTHPNE